MREPPPVSDESASRQGDCTHRAQEGGELEVFVSAIKETNYFAWDPERPGARLWETTQHNEFPVRSLADYEALFAEAGDAIAIGEVSPICLGSLFAPQRIRDTLPEARIVGTLRNPIHRAHSGYWM